MKDIHADPSSCRRWGWLVAKSNCFALRCEDGGEYWLDMDPIPQHLLDQRVTIDGILSSRGVIAVAGIGPA